MYFQTLTQLHASSVHNHPGIAIANIEFLAYLLELKAEMFSHHEHSRSVFW